MLLNCGAGEDFFRVPWTARKSNQSILKEINTEYSLEGLMLKLPLDLKTWLLGEDPDAGKDWGQEEKGMTEDEMVGEHHWLNGHELEQAPGFWWWTGKTGVLQSMGSQRVEHDWETELNWAKAKFKKWRQRNEADWLQIILQSYSNQNSLIQVQTQKSVEQDRNTRIKPMHIWSINLRQRR